MSSYKFPDYVVQTNVKKILLVHGKMAFDNFVRDTALVDQKSIRYRTGSSYARVTINNVREHAKPIEAVVYNVGDHPTLETVPYSPALAMDLEYQRNSYAKIYRGQKRHGIIYVINPPFPIDQERSRTLEVCFINTEENINVTGMFWIVQKKEIEYFRKEHDASVALEKVKNYMCTTCRQVDVGEGECEQCCRKKKKRKIEEEDVCACCGKSEVEYCSQCQVVPYCSRDCLVKDWPNHSKVCSASNK